MRKGSQLFTDLPELCRTNSVHCSINPEENDGKFLLYENGEMVKIELHSLGEEKFRKNAINKLRTIAQACLAGIEMLEALPPIKTANLPPLNPKSDEANA
jgi:hypothetical protein